MAYEQERLGLQIVAQDRLFRRHTTGIKSTYYRTKKDQYRKLPPDMPSSHGRFKIKNVGTLPFQNY